MDEKLDATDSNTSTNDSTAAPRRSARLLNKINSGSTNRRSDSPLKRDNDDAAEEEARSNKNTRITSERGSGNVTTGTDSADNTREAAENVTVSGTDNATTEDVTSADISATTTGTTAASSTTEPSTTNNTRTRPVRTASASRTSATTSLPVFSFSIGFGPMPASLAASPSSAATFIINSSSTSTASTQDLPPEVQRMIAEMTEGMRSSNSTTGIGIGISGMSGITIPIGVVMGSADGSNTTTGGTGFLELARQMFQIISRGRSVNSPASTSPEFQSMTDDLETLLNDFFSRMFASSTPAGLSSERIAQLPETRDQTEIDCSICRETARVGEEKCVELPCKHSFHFECIEPWLKRVPSCPICRKVIE